MHNHKHISQIFCNISWKKRQNAFKEFSSSLKYFVSGRRRIEFPREYHAYKEHVREETETIHGTHTNKAQRREKTEAEADSRREFELDLA